MRIGAIFPQTEIGNDPGAIRAYAQGVEALGFAHLLAYDHVLGAGLANRPDWSGPYTSETPFHEIFVLFGFLAAVTERVGLVTDVVILPQRQTALVAKQAAEIDVLSGGRLRLGIGVGWNAVEYVGLNQNFQDRGIRSEEQIAVLRALWQEPVVDFTGRWHRIPEAGIKPLPVQRPIPVWIGGGADATLNRIARIGDGWFPQAAPDDAMRTRLEHLRAQTVAAGRPADAVGIEARLSLGQVPESGWAAHAAAWRELGATHLGINTMGFGRATVDDHLAALERAKGMIEE